MSTILLTLRLLVACYRVYAYFRDKDDKLAQLEHLIWFGIMVCI